MKKVATRSIQELTGIHNKIHQDTVSAHYQTYDEFSQHSNGGGWVHKDARVAEGVYVGRNCIVVRGRITGDVRITGYTFICGANLTINGSVKISGNTFICGYNVSITGKVEVESSRILESAYLIGNVRVINSVMYGNSKVMDSAFVRRALLRDRASVSGDAKLLGERSNDKNYYPLYIQDRAIVTGRATLRGRVRMADCAKVCDSAVVKGNVHGVTSLYGHVVICGNAIIDKISLEYGRWKSAPKTFKCGHYSANVAGKNRLRIGCQNHTIYKWKKLGKRIAKANDFTRLNVARRVISAMIKDHNLLVKNKQLLAH